MSATSQAALGQCPTPAVPAFGLGPVPRLYSAAMEEVYLRVRGAGARLTYMIDDQCSWASTEGQAKALCQALVELLAALGFYLRPDKCQLRPSRKVSRCWPSSQPGQPPKYTQPQFPNARRNSLAVAVPNQHMRGATPAQLPHCRSGSWA